MFLVFRTDLGWSGALVLRDPGSVGGKHTVVDGTEGDIDRRTDREGREEVLEVD